MEWLLIYAFVMVDKFSSALSMGWAAMWIGGALLGFTLFIGCFAGIENNLSISEQLKQPLFSTAIKLAKWAMIVGLIFGTVGHFIPSQKDLAIIVGSGVTYKAVTSETGKRLGGKAIELLEKKLDGALSDPVESKPQAETPKAPAVIEGKAL